MEETIQKKDDLLERVFEFYTSNSVSVLQVEMKDVSINISKNGKALEAPVDTVKVPVQAEVPASKKPAVEVEQIISAPMVGVFYRSSSPETEPFVEEGTVIRKGDVICMIEAMKSFNEMRAEVDGRVSEILVSNGQMVEFGQSLFKVIPE